MKIYQYIGIALLLAGLILLWSPRPLTEIIDTTPPEWITATDGGIGISPRDGAVYQSLDRIQAGVKDLESGVASVTATVDQISYPLTLKYGDMYSGIWIYMFNTSLPEGNHTMQLVAINYAGLQTSYTASFEIYTELQGKWYINDIEITDPYKVLTFTNNTLTFKFVKIQGASDNMITCSVNWTGPETDTQNLAYVETNTWKATHSFKSGVYTITFKASDGANTIQFTVFEVHIQEKGLQSPTLTYLQQTGIALTIVGFVLLVFPVIKKKQ